MNYKRVIVALLCFILVLQSGAYSSQNSQNESQNWFHHIAKIFRIKYILPLNMSSDTAITMDVTVPENNTFQKILSVSSDPHPNSTFVDKEGLRKLRYELRTSLPLFLNITIHYTVMVLFSSFVGDLTQIQTPENIPEEIRKYTLPAPYIESDHIQIIGNATIISGNATNVDSIVTRVFDFVSNSTLFAYNETIQDIHRDKYSHVRGALWALQTRNGVCFDFAHLFVALLRAKGIPSRISEGIVLDGRSGFILHDWAEVYFSGIGWIPYDPTWGEAKSYIHMKILNPSYDDYSRWNYTGHTGQVYSFPSNSTYITDQVFIENSTSSSIVDLFSFSSESGINLIRMLRLNNETISSSLSITSGDRSLNMRYGRVQISLSNSFGAKSFDYLSSDDSGLAQKQVALSAPFHLIFSDSNFLGIGYANFTYFYGSVHFTFVEPLLWIGASSLLTGLIIFVIVMVWLKRKTLPPTQASY